MRVLTSIFLWLVAGLLPVSVASPQDATIVVEVSSADHPLAGAMVELLVGDSTVGVTPSDSLGVARVSPVRAGAYRIRVTSIGYGAWMSDLFTLQGDTTRLFEAALEPAPVELEGIVARADRIRIERQNTEFSTTVEEKAIGLLPLAYDPHQLVALTPGARPDHVWGGATFQANNYQIDGLSANHPGLGGSVFQPSTLWIDRIEIQGLGAGAEHGGFQGGLVNVVTKRGRNEFSGMLRTRASNDALSGSNLVLSEIGAETIDRYDVEGEVSGALVRDRLFFYLGGSRIDRSARVLNHVDFEGRFSPVHEEMEENKLFGKITWEMGELDQLEVSGAYLGANAENYGMTGYEGVGAASRFSSPSWLGNLAWRKALGEKGVLEARLNHFSRDERSEPYQGRERPGVLLFELTPPYTTFGNAPFTLRSAPSSTSATLTSTFRFRAGEQEHLLLVGGEYTRGSFLDRRIRNGGMTWMPVLWSGFDPESPTTWAHPTEGFTPTGWGGEVYLDSDVMNAAGFLQSSISLGRLVLTPGFRWGMWQGWVDPRDGDRFKAVEDRGFDPRIGATLDLGGGGTFLLKGHWGRYHQDMISQMFDRAAGTDAFTNREVWYDHRNPGVAGPAGFSKEERDALAEQGLLTREAVISLNETGPVVDYHQPYIDQWLVGMEKEIGGSAKFEALFTRRTNHQMIALVDRNRDENYTLFERVRVNMGGYTGSPLPFSGGNVYMKELYIPNNAIVDELQYCAANPSICDAPVGLSFSDTLTLGWDPDYVLTNAPDGRREFWQAQFVLEVARPHWGGSFSAVFTEIEGNLDNVSGYADLDDLGPGPYVRVNEGLNSYGALPNFSETEAKVSIWGDLPWGFRGGALWAFQSGDHFSPQFQFSGQMSFYGYAANVGPSFLCNPGDSSCKPPTGDPLSNRLVQAVEGHRVFIGPRGKPQMGRRTNVDLRVERIFEMERFDLGVSFDLFNAFGGKDVTEVQTLVNHGEQFYYFFEDISTPFRREWAGKWYQSPMDRVPPRSLRLGVAAYF